MEAARNPLVLELHPLCTLFPRLEGAEFEALKADIIANGQLEPITVHDGQVLEGGNRYRACIEAGIEPILKDFTGANPVAFVLSANLHRRHLTPGQQAAIVASAQDWTRAQTVGNPAFKGDAQKCNGAPLETAADRAAQSGASLRTQKMADKVAKASPDLAKQVAHGEISLPKALEQLAPKVAETPRAPAWPFPNASPGSPAADFNAAQQVGQHDAPDEQPEQSPGGEPEPDPFDLVVAENKALEQEKLALQGEIAALNERIAILTRDDIAAAADEWKLKFEQLAGRNRQLQQTAHDAQTAEKRASEMLAKVRRALGVESNAEILPALSERRAA
ncbi:ParB/RepB/Spo0J family partition protein [Massilia sp. BKSP1R2A-1]|uniref:ParB/RepB/Spo0J family partition protein n=1 Tax=Massilia sp. BKSP1R2A-1 TaxID=3422595 RepID=UPI003D328C84